MKLAVRNGKNSLLDSSFFEDDFNNLVDNLLSPSFLRRELSDFNPPIELGEDNEKFVLRAQIPGFNKEDIDIQVFEDSVILSGESQCECQNNEQCFHRSEFRYGKFARKIQVPKLINKNKVKAQYNNGILSLELPKQEDASEKAVKIKL